MTEIIIGNKKIIEVPQISIDCRMCFFYNFTDCFDIRQLIGDCDSEKREDKQNVIFKEVKQ